MPSFYIWFFVFYGNYNYQARLPAAVSGNEQLQAKESYISIERQKDRKPRSQVRILIYRTWAIVHAPDIKYKNYPMAVYVCHKKLCQGRLCVISKRDALLHDRWSLTCTKLETSFVFVPLQSIKDIAIYQMIKQHGMLNARCYL